MKILSPSKGVELLQHLSDKQPPYSECAYISKRSLSALPWLPGISENVLLDALNLEVSHEHILFEQSHDNIGWGPDGLFAEDVAKKNYRRVSACLDGSKLREVLQVVEPNGRFKERKLYNVLRNNCQDFTSRVADLYNAIAETAIARLQVD